MTELKITKARVAVLVGVKGKTKRKIEKQTRTRLNISSKEGEVEITGDSLDIFQAEPVIKSISRGFNPEIALTLLDEENCFELLELKEVSGKSKKKLARMKSRLIGTNGKCRKFIEGICGVSICIYGKTVGIIGRIENVHLARIAVQDILRGAPHGPVYKKLEERMRDLER